MTTPKKAKAPAEPVKYKDLRALKIAKSAKKLPRGLKAFYDVGCPQIVFKVTGQTEPVLLLDADTFVKDSLRAAGFKLG